MHPTPSYRPLALLLGAAAVIKAVYLVQYLALPIFDGPVFDSLAYLRQARAIRGGHFGDASLVAFSPLYGYVLAASGAPLDLGRVVVIQLVLGCINVLLVYLIAERWFDRRAAWLSATLYLGYGLLAFYETKILAETLGLTLALATMWLCAHLHDHPRALRYALGAGLTLAVAVLARSSLLLVAPFVVVAALLPWGDADVQALRPRVQRALAIALGLALVWTANGLWNRAHTGLFVPVILRSATASRASQVAWDGNLSVFSTREDGQVGVFDVITQAQARLAGQSPANEQPFDLVGVLRQAPVKARDTLRSIETDFQYGYYGERTEVPILNLLSVSFGALLVLSLLGLVALYASRRLRLLWPLSPWWLGGLATTVLFHPSSRYRLPMALPMVLLAGFGLAWLSRVPRDRRFWVTACGVAALVGYFTYGTVTYELRDPAMWELRMAESAIAAWDAIEAERRIQRAQRLAGDKPHIQQRIAYLRTQFTPD